MQSKTASPIFDSWAARASAALTGPQASEAFQRYLEGIGLPAIDNYTEADVRLRQLVEDHPELLTVVTALTQKMLQAVLEDEVRSARINRLLFNLFYLCAGLRQAEVLAGPLRRILEARAVPQSAEYQGIPVVVALYAGLVQNQPDQNLKRFWEQMITGEANYLLGTKRDGSIALAKMPSAMPSPKEFLIVYSGDQLAIALPNGVIRLDEMLKPEEELISSSLQNDFRGFFGVADSPPKVEARVVECFAISNVSSSLRRKHSPILPQWEAKRKAKLVID